MLPLLVKKAPLRRKSHNHRIFAPVISCLFQNNAPSRFVLRNTSWNRKYTFRANALAVCLIAVYHKQWGDGFDFGFCGKNNRAFYKV